jgi:hypothetical protein
MTSLKQNLPIPASMRHLHGGADIDWYLALIPVLMELHDQNPEGWRASQLLKAAIELGAHNPKSELFPSKVARTLELFDRIGYVLREDDIYVVNTKQIQQEIDLAVTEYTHQVAVGQQFGDTLRSAAALGSKSTRANAKTEKKGIISRIKSILMN